MCYGHIMVKEIYTKADKKRFFKKIMPYISRRLQSLTDEYTYREIAEICGLDPSRITQAVKRTYLNEQTLRSFIGGEVVSIKDIKANVEGLDRKDMEYLQNLSATSNPALVRRLVRLVDKFGLDNTVVKFDQLLREVK